MIATLRARISDLIPHPMGAPETRELRRSRCTLILALAIAGLCAAAFKPLLALVGTTVIALIVGAAVVLAIELPRYCRAKLKADDDWLTVCIARNRDEDRAAAPPVAAAEYLSSDCTVGTALRNAIGYASQRHQSVATCEHLLLALTHDEHAAQVLRACGVDVRGLAFAVIDHIDSERGCAGVDGHVVPPLSEAMSSVVERAQRTMSQLQAEPLTCADVLVALFSERGSVAVGLLTRQGMTRLDAVSYVRHGVALQAVLPHEQDHEA